MNKLLKDDIQGYPELSLATQSEERFYAPSVGACQCIYFIGTVTYMPKSMWGHSKI